MNREILFKAKRTDNGEWVEGYYANCLHPTSDVRTGHFIIEYPGEYHEIYTDTICQYTGLTDKNGKKIWENDIIKFEDTGEEGYEYKEGFDYINRAKVIWNKGRFELACYLCDNSGTLDLMNNSPEEFYDMFEVYAEAIGNVFDNPELLEREENAE